ncbi:MAG: urate oxidase [Candidatus Methylacidiphilales bacterium]
MPLLTQSYGKQRVRFLRTVRHPDRHEVLEIKAGIALDGDFSRAYLADDNSQVVATDTMKNTLMVLGYTFTGTSPEAFALYVRDHFLGKYPHVTSIRLDLEQAPWSRCNLAGKPHPHTFQFSGPTRTVSLHATRDSLTLQGGLKDWRIMKTTGSGFVGFPRDEFTTLPETDDRILATEATISWTYGPGSADYETIHERVLPAMLHIFAETYSPSVQRTLFLMGEAALAAAPELATITLALPNKHYLPINYAAFGLPAQQTLCWLPTDEPHGQIQATMSR